MKLLLSHIYKYLHRLMTVSGDRLCREQLLDFEKSLKQCLFHGFLEKVLITRLTTQKWLDVGPEWTVDEHRSAHSQMEYEYRVTCMAHYYGKGCENLCRPRDDSFGHYSCSPTGERVCLSGWKGDYCNSGKSSTT